MNLCEAQAMLYAVLLPPEHKAVRALTWHRDTPELAEVITGSTEWGLEAASRYAAALGAPVTSDSLVEEGEAAGSDEVQARALALLYEYAHQREGSRLLVLPAGLLLCVLNLVYGNSRPLPSADAPPAIYRIPVPLRVVQFEPQLLARKSRVFVIHTTAGSFVLKETLQPLGARDTLQQTILAALNGRTDRVPRLLLSNSRQRADGRLYNLKVLKFVPGEHLFGPLKEAEAQELVAATFDLSEHLRAIGPLLADTAAPTLRDILAEARGGLSPGLLYAYGGDLLAQQERNPASWRNDLAPVNFDLHRANLLWEHGRVRFIDLETFVKAPALFQLASMLVSAVLLVTPDPVLVEQFIAAWPRPVERSEVLFYMKVRAFVGAAYFQQRLEQGAAQAGDAMILTAYLAVIDRLESMSSD